MDDASFPIWIRDCTMEEASKLTFAHLDAARLRLRVEEPHLGHGPRGPALAQQESTPHVIGGHMEAESSIRGARADLGDDSGHEERLEVTGSSPR